MCIAYTDLCSCSCGCRTTAAWARFFDCPKFRAIPKDESGCCRAVREETVRKDWRCEGCSHHGKAYVPSQPLLGRAYMGPSAAMDGPSTVDEIHQAKAKEMMFRDPTEQDVTKDCGTIGSKIDRRKAEEYHQKLSGEAAASKSLLLDPPIVSSILEKISRSDASQSINAVAPKSQDLNTRVDKSGEPTAGTGGPTKGFRAPELPRIPFGPSFFNPVDKFKRSPGRSSTPRNLLVRPEIPETFSTTLPIREFKKEKENETETKRNQYEPLMKALDEYEERHKAPAPRRQKLGFNPFFASTTAEPKVPSSNPNKNHANPKASATPNITRPALAAPYGERRQVSAEHELQQKSEVINAKMAEKTNGTEDKNENNSNNEKTSNMLKPLAWDGSPIPTGLWKLHGGFPCEICDNFVYTGQRSFDMHFSEPRHQYGLKSLGIANSTQFRGLTGIKEACDLWEKIQEDAKEKATVSVVQQEENEVNTVPACIGSRPITDPEPQHPLERRRKAVEALKLRAKSQAERRRNPYPRTKVSLKDELAAIAKIEPNHRRSLGNRYVKQDMDWDVEMEDPVNTTLKDHENTVEEITKSKKVRRKRFARLDAKHSKKFQSSFGRISPVSTIAILPRETNAAPKYPYTITPQPSYDGTIFRTFGVYEAAIPYREATPISRATLNPSATATSNPYRFVAATRIPGVAGCDGIPTTLPHDTARLGSPPHPNPSAAAVPPTSHLHISQSPHYPTASIDSIAPSTAQAASPVLHPSNSYRRPFGEMNSETPKLVKEAKQERNKAASDTAICGKGPKEKDEPECRMDLLRRLQKAKNEERRVEIERIWHRLQHKERESATFGSISKPSAKVLKQSDQKEVERRVIDFNLQAPTPAQLAAVIADRAGHGLATESRANDAAPKLAFKDTPPKLRSDSIYDTIQAPERHATNLKDPGSTEGKPKESTLVTKQPRVIVAKGFQNNWHVSFEKGTALLETELVRKQPESDLRDSFPSPNNDTLSGYIPYKTGPFALGAKSEGEEDMPELVPDPGMEKHEKGEGGKEMEAPETEMADVPQSEQTERSETVTSESEKAEAQDSKDFDMELSGGEEGEDIDMAVEDEEWTDVKSNEGNEWEMVSEGEWASPSESEL